MKNLKSIVLIVVFVLCSSPVAAAEYTVQSGDTLSGIAYRTTSTVDELVGINKIDNKDLIYPHQVLRYISSNDATNARLWLSAAEQSDNLKDHVKSFLAKQLVYLENAQVVFGDECNAVHFEDILLYSSFYMKERIMTTSQ